MKSVNSDATSNVHGRIHISVFDKDNNKVKSGVIRNGRTARMADQLIAALASNSALPVTHLYARFGSTVIQGGDPTFLSQADVAEHTGAGEGSLVTPLYTPPIVDSSATGYTANRAVWLFHLNPSTPTLNGAVYEAGTTEILEFALAAQQDGNRDNDVILAAAGVTGGPYTIPIGGHLLAEYQITAT